jgi:hypothetical protein
MTLTSLFALKKVITMTDLELLNEQIAAQITGMYTFDVSFSDIDNEAFRLVVSDDDWYAWPLFCKPKKISTGKAKILRKLADNFIAKTDVREFTLDSGLTYDEFMDEFYNSPVPSLSDHILIKHGDNKSQFAHSINVRPQQITEWVNKEFIVANGILYSPRREL